MGAEEGHSRTEGRAQRMRQAVPPPHAVLPLPAGSPAWGCMLMPGAPALLRPLLQHRISRALSVKVSGLIESE